MKPTILRTLAVCLACASAAAAPVQAQPAESLSSLLVKLRDNDEVGKVKKSLTEDVPMTTAPAAYVLGIAGDEVPRATTFRSFATGLARGVGKDGKLGNAVAAEVSPLLALKVLSLDDQRDPVRRALARTTFSVVSTQGGGSSDKARSAYGIQSVLYSHELDRALALAGSAECTSAAQRFLGSLTVGAPPPRLDPGGLPATPVADEALRKQVGACQSAIDGILNRWNPSMLAFGFGQAFKSPDNTVAGLKKANKVAWLTGSLGFGSGADRAANERMGGLLTLHSRLERDGIAETPGAAAARMTEDADLLGASLRIGKARFNGVFEYSQRKSKIAGMADENRRRTVIGVETRLREDLYLSFAVASETGRRDGRNSGLTLANLNWGFGDKAIFAP